MADQLTTTGIVQDLARVILESGLPQDKIAHALGMDEAVLHRIVDGGDCSIGVLENLCDFFGLGLRPRIEPPRIYRWPLN